MPTSCDELDELLGRLGVPESAREDIAAGRPQPGSSDWHEMERLRRELISGTDPPNWPTPASTAPASRRWLHLWALLGVIPHVLELNGSRGIPESITWATLLDVGVNVERFVVRFQQRFELAPGGRVADDDVLRFVFGSAKTDLKRLQPKTTLGRAVVAHLSQDRHFVSRSGWLRLSDEHAVG